MVSAKKVRKSSESSASTSKTATPSASTTNTTTTSPSTSTATLIDSHVSSQQAQKAFSALSSYISKRNSQSSKNELPLDSSSPSSDLVFLQITVKKLSNTKMIKPVRIPLKHSLNQKDVSVCLLVKDPQREYKDLLTALNIKLVSRVVGVAKLKGKFKPFDARRQLIQDHDLFLADDRIVPLLPKLLGKKWFDAKKQPVSISLSKPKKLKEEIERAISSTYYIQNKGSCSSIKIGSLSLHTPSQLVENLSESLPKIVSRIPGGWSNVQGIDIKTSNSIALPIWNCKLGEAVDDETNRWNGMEVKELNEDDDEEDQDNSEDEEEDEEDDEKVEVIHISKSNKGKSKDKKPTSSISKDAKVKAAGGPNGKVGKKQQVLKSVEKVPEVKTSISEEKLPKKKVKKSVVENDSGASAATKKKLAGLKKLEKKA